MTKRYQNCRRKAERRASIKTESEIEANRWENRRKMAWKAFKLASRLSVLTVIGIFVLVIFAPADQVKAASEHWAALGIVFGGLWGVVMAYIGSSAYSDVRLFKK